MASVAETSGLHLELSNDQLMLRELAREFTRKEITPQAEQYDRSGEWPWPIFHKARKVGLINLNIPEAYGGIGASVLEECIVAEEMAYGCSGIETALMLNQLGAVPLLIAGTEEQQSRYLPAFKNLQVSVPRVDAPTGTVGYALVPVEEEMTIQDLLRHTAGLVYEDTSHPEVRAAYLREGVTWRRKSGESRGSATLESEAWPFAGGRGSCTSRFETLNAFKRGVLCRSPLPIPKPPGPFRSPQLLVELPMPFDRRRTSLMRRGW